MFNHVSFKPVIAIACFATILFSLETVAVSQVTNNQDIVITDDFSTTIELARNGNPEAMYVVALRLIDEKNSIYEKDAFGWALNAARAGHPKAAELTGRLYRTGKGVDINYVKSRKWLLRAITRGSVGAHFELALLYADEDNPSNDKDEASRYMEIAISKSEPRACLVAAKAKIDNGFDIRKALKELTCAANGGIVTAMLIIADYFIEKRSPNATFQAKQWLQKAADAGSDEALKRLAELP